MGNVALACAKAGYSVQGSDEHVYPPMSDILRESGITYAEGYSESNIADCSNATVIVGNAISRGNIELEYALDKKVRLISMPELVGRELIGNHTSVVIAGTHGKTSTASLTTWLLESAGYAPGFLIGGVPGNFTSGCRPALPSKGIFVSEGDEYDSAFFDKRSKFLHYRPDIAVINNIEFDHADIFNSLDDIIKSFTLFGRLVPRRGVLLINAASPICRDVAAVSLTSVETFGLEPDAYWRAADIDYAADGTSFTLLRNGEEIGQISMPLFGEMNVRNALAAAAAAIHAVERGAARADEIPLPPDQAVARILQGFSGFALPKRRLEVISSWHGATVVDDFAHHPTAIVETLRAAAQKFAGRRIIACFEPRSNTTTRHIFQHELAECFTGAAAVVIGALNRPERYAAEKRLNVSELQKDLESRGIPTFILPESDYSRTDWGAVVAAHLERTVQQDDVILLFSNGNFGGLRRMLS